MLGYSEAEFRGRSPIELTHEDDRSVTEAFRATRTAGDARTIRREKRYRRKDGSVIWVEWGSGAAAVGRACLFPPLSSGGAL